MKLLVAGLLVLTAQCVASRGSSLEPAEYDMQLYEHSEPRPDYSPCKQEVPNCTECLRKKSCTWCSGSGDPTGVCELSKHCPSSRKITCREDDKFEDNKFEDNKLEDQLQDLNQVDRSYVLDVKEVTLNASYLCHLKANCSDCTALEFCAWCQAKRSCIAYSGASTTETCGSKSWYKNQCVYSGFTTPCHKRKLNCKECTYDGVCYWCASTKVCGYYPRDGFHPANCSAEHWYFTSCSRVKEIVVLLPIFLIILTPILAYAVMYCILGLLKREGYSGIDDSDSSDDDDDLKRRAIMLHHASPGGKTDKLRKKYNLDKKP